MSPIASPSTLRLALPKGRMQEEVFALLHDAGVRIRLGTRGYRPTVSLPDCEVKLLKPQNIVEMLQAGSRDLGFAGADWVAELQARVVEVLDTGLDPVRLVSAAPEALLVSGALPDRPLVIASEYPRLTETWVKRRGLEAQMLHSFGATEVFPPEDADLIVDNTATGETLQANDLVVIDELMRSTTRLYASPQALENPAKRKRIEDLVMVLRSVLEARGRVMVEVNCRSECLEAVCAILPCMREPTIAQLRGGAGFAVKAAVPRGDIPLLVPRLKACGGTDIAVSALAQIVP